MSLVRYFPCLEHPWVFTIFVRYVPLSQRPLGNKVYPGEFGELCPNLTQTGIWPATTDGTPPTHGLVGPVA